ncbi:hypothetical protein QTG54_015797 [Skeletonema marinoi]|uniref:Uncharacterized protein n=1 Tax=Skeletonema marinoi TaxID=267567 RepID=A0AAD8XTD9_9STRA|nr:hypothetical protein QTG54_015797 [Skeletonema marinoi]
MEEAYEDPVEEEVVVHRSEEVVRAASQEAEKKAVSRLPQGGPPLSAATGTAHPPPVSLVETSTRPWASLHTPHREIETNSTPSILTTESCEQVMKVAVQPARSPSLSDDSSVSSFEEFVEIGPKPVLKVGDTIQYYAHGQVGVPYFLTESKVTRVNADPANPCVTLAAMDTIGTIGCGMIKRIDPPDVRWRTLERFDLIESQTENEGDWVRKEASTFREILQGNMQSVAGGQCAPMDMLQDVARPASSTCGDDDSSDDEVPQMQSQEVPQQKRLRRTRRNPTPKREEDFVYDC